MMSMSVLIENLTKNEYDTYTSYYIDLVPKGPMVQVMQQQMARTLDFFSAIPNHLLQYRYAQGKWSIKEVFQHLIDTERIFAYRALRFARGDAQELPGFEVEKYVDTAVVDHRSMSDMLREFKFLKESNILMARGLPPESLKIGGVASDQYISARAALTKLIGHEIHHCKVVFERYL